MFLPERNLKDIIISCLKSEERSISSLYRHFKKEGYKFHRLFLTGYLKALLDSGVLREKYIPPAKVYTVSAKRQKNLYEAVSEKCRAVEPDERRQVRLAISVLQKLLRRPIFYRELRECGFGSAVEAPSISGEQREEAVRHLRKSGIQIPTNELAYFVDERRNEARDAVIAELLIERYGMTAMVQETKQMKLAEH